MSDVQSFLKQLRKLITAKNSTVSIYVRAFYFFASDTSKISGHMVEVPMSPALAGTSLFYVSSFVLNTFKQCTMSQPKHFTMIILNVAY